jgi:TldD protein
MLDALRSLVSSSSRGASYVEARYQARSFSEVNFANGRLERVRMVESAGCGIRVLVDGCWGFSSTASMSKDDLKESLAHAVSMARVLGRSKKNKVKGLAESKMARGTFVAKAKGDLAGIDIEQKIRVAREAEAAARKHAKVIKTASATYRDILDHKAIANSDGAEVEIFDSKPEFNVTAVARDGAQSVTASEGIGITGGWDDLFKKGHLEYAQLAAEKAAKLLGAKYATGEKTVIILDPGMVGLLCHEAVGHTVEADFVLSGSVVKDRLGQKVASDLVTLVDSGRSDISDNAAGTIGVDDEGVEAGRTAIIENGVLKSFLHNRESAFEFGTASTGNARAFTYSDEPLIRMRNTYIEPRSDTLDEMIKETKHGYLVKGARNGQADANGEFMFGAQEAHLIANGEIRELMRGASISGNAFDVLQSIDMVGSKFEYDIGTGYCGKYQPAKVDGGGPHVRCTAIIGGMQ